MPLRVKFTSAAFVVLTGAFVFAKFHLTRLSVPAFRLDPCDAVVHFAFFTMLFALIGSLRAMRPYREGVAYTTQQTYVLRSLQAVALAAMVAFVSHAVDLTRHPTMWVGAAWRTQLLALFGVFAAVPVAMELLVRFAAQPIQSNAEPPPRKGAVLACLLALATLVFCPEYDVNISSETAHILTVIVGGLVVLVPIGYLLPVLVPDQSGGQRGGKAFFNARSERSALLVGILIGTVLFWIDAHRTGAMERLLPVLKLVGPTMGLLIVYSFFAEALGLKASKRVNQ